MSTTTTEVAKASTSAPATIKELLSGDAFKEQVSRALPRHLTPDRFIRCAITAMTRTPKLAQCDPPSFFEKLLTLSQLGLEPDGYHAHLIPFENRRRGVVECQLIVDYKGLVKLVMQTGALSNIHADVVCEEDDFEVNIGQITRHVINYRKPRGKVYAAYAIARFKDGSTKCEVMTLDEIEAIRKRSRVGESGSWVTDWNEMAKKTVFRRESKWLPITAELRDALDKDDDRIDTDAAAERSTRKAGELLARKASEQDRTGAIEAEPTPEPPDDLPLTDKKETT